MTTPILSAIVLAGGEGKRVDGEDKGLLTYKRKKLIEYVFDAVSPQVDDIVISANRNIKTYQSLTSCNVVPDTGNQRLGPLSGITTCLPHCRHETVLVIACDMPNLPSDLAKILYENIQEKMIAIAEVKQRHQLALLLKKSLHVSLQKTLKNNQLSLIKWVESQEYCSVSFDEHAEHFININSLPS